MITGHEWADLLAAEHEVEQILERRRLVAELQRDRGMTEDEAWRWVHGQLRTKSRGILKVICVAGAP
jgi:hypothetical protein